MKEYIPRNIAFKELMEVNDWSIKVYIFTKDGSFEHHQLYQSAIDHIPKWLAMENSFNANHESKSWRDNVLNHPSAPLYKSYLDDVYHGIF